MTGRPAMARRPAVVSGVRRTFASAVFRIGARRAIGTPVFPALVAAGAVRAVAPAMIAILRATFGRSLGLRLGRFLGTLRHRDRKQRYDKNRNQTHQLFSHRPFFFNNQNAGGPILAGPHDKNGRRLHRIIRHLHKYTKILAIIIIPIIPS